MEEQGDGESREDEGEAGADLGETADAVEAAVPRSGLLLVGAVLAGVAVVGASAWYIHRQRSKKKANETKPDA